MHSRQQKNCLELSKKSTVTLNRGIQDYLVLHEVKNQHVHPFMAIPLGRRQSSPTIGVPSKTSATEGQMNLDPIKFRGSLIQDRNPQLHKNEENSTIFNLKIFCSVEEGLLPLFNKLNDQHYINGIVNLSKCVN